MYVKWLERLVACQSANNKWWMDDYREEFELKDSAGRRTTHYKQKNSPFDAHRRLHIFTSYHHLGG